MIIQILKNWKSGLIVAAMVVLFSQFHSCRMGQVRDGLRQARADNGDLIAERDAAKQDVKLAGVVLDSTHAAARRLTAIRQADSTAFAKRIDGMQSVVSVLQKERVKLRNENEYLVKNPVRIDLIDRTQNFWGNLKDSTYTEGWKWVKD
jgi:hypothetical protein